MDVRPLIDAIVRQTAVVLFAACALAVAACATTESGGGSNTSWLDCKADVDCPNADHCVAGRCGPASMTARQTGSGAVSDSGGDAVASGGAGGSAGSASGGRAVASGGAGGSAGSASGGSVASGGSGGLSCPVYSFFGPWGDQRPAPSELDPSLFGCHTARDVAFENWPTTNDLKACPGTSTDCVYTPSAIPRGTCGPSDAPCAVWSYAPCNCGQGPYVDVLWDGWTCQCNAGQWDCRAVVLSGGSCFAECGDAGL